VLSAESISKIRNGKFPHQFQRTVCVEGIEANLCTRMSRADLSV
jgi:hypothetical protein